MNAAQQPIDTRRYAKCIEVSKRISWDIDRDVIRGRKFDFSKKFLPDGISQVDRLEFLDADERRLLSQVQGRTYANIFGLAERFIGTKMLEISRDHWLGDQTALEALVRFTGEELKHQALFRAIERLVAEGMPDGYKFLPQPNVVASFVLSKSTWAVLALTCHIELFTQVHYRQSIEPDENLSELYKDVFFFPWKEESQHAILDELEWQRENGKLSARERDKAVGDLIELVAGVDGILQMQAPADVEYSVTACARPFTPAETERLRAGVLKAYRWQYIMSGVQDPRFNEVLGGMITSDHGKRIGEALAPLMHSLSIEGYRVTATLVEKIRDGHWNPDGDENDRNTRDTMAARGYFETHNLVKQDLVRVVNGENAGTVFRNALPRWYRALFSPSVQAGILEASALPGAAFGVVPGGLNLKATRGFIKCRRSRSARARA